MWVSDQTQLNPDEYWTIKDEWEPEWERKDEEPCKLETIPKPNVIELRRKRKADFQMPSKLIHHEEDARFVPDIHVVSSPTTFSSDGYNMDEVDVQWLDIFNEDRGIKAIEMSTFEKIIEAIENICFRNLQDSLKNDATLNMKEGDAICDVCQNGYSEDSNKIATCINCKLHVHQLCYGMKNVKTNWKCYSCSLDVQGTCFLCLKVGGAMKPVGGNKWCHLICALWIPEVSVNSVKKMEPIKMRSIPRYRWKLTCSVCRKKGGACVTCSAESCKVAFHVTCAFKASIRRWITVSDDDQLKKEFYCQKHCDEKSAEPNKGKMSEVKTLIEEKRILREKILKAREHTFYEYATLEEVKSACPFEEKVVESIYNFWKLKRRTNLDRPLLQPDEVIATRSSS